MSFFGGGEGDIFPAKQERVSLSVDESEEFVRMELSLCELRESNGFQMIVLSATLP